MDLVAGEDDLGERVAVERGGVTTPNPAAGWALAPGDRLLVFARNPEIARVRALLAGEP